MSRHNSLSDIPVVVQSSRAPGVLHWQRRAMQAGFVVILLFIPLSGLFRIDPSAGFVVLDRQIWFSDFFLVFGLWMTLASMLVMLYSVVGTAFCGWACPQNSLSEWANWMTHKLLGKRAEVSLNGEAMKVGSTKNRWSNWLVLAASFVLVAMLTALIPMFYFYPPDVMWSFISLREDERLAGSLHWIYSIFVLIILVDAVLIRHFMCRFMCIYKVWQHSFKTRETLHLVYDQSRSDECSKCNYCVTACFLQIDPRKANAYDGCINCGECVVACDSLQVKKGRTGKGLLRFKFGQTAAKLAGISKMFFKTNLGSLFSRVVWAIPLMLLGGGMFAWGLWDYQPYRLSVYQAYAEKGTVPGEYRINVVNKMYRQGQLHVEIKGLDENFFQLPDNNIEFSGIARRDLKLQIRPDLPGGLYAFQVIVTAADGWQGQYEMRHHAASSQEGG